MEVLYLSCGILGRGFQLLVVNGAILVEAPSMKSLGLILDVSLIMEAQISSIAQLTFYYLRPVWQLVPYLTPCDLGHSDLCNGCFQTRLLQLTLFGAAYDSDLETAVSVTAWTLTVLSVWTSVQPLLHQLHWLEYRRLKVMVIARFNHLFGFAITLE